MVELCAHLYTVHFQCTWIVIKIENRLLREMQDLHTDTVRKNSYMLPFRNIINPGSNKPHRKFTKSSESFVFFTGMFMFLYLIDWLAPMNAKIQMFNQQV